MNKENENPLRNDNVIYTLPRKPPVDLDELNFSKITSLSRTTSLKIKLMKDESLNQKPVITPRSSSRNIEKAKLKRKKAHEGKVKTPTSSGGSKSTTPLKDKHFIFNFSTSPKSAKEQPPFEIPSNYNSAKSAETSAAAGYDDIKLKEVGNPTLKGAKSLTNLNSHSPIPKFFIKVCNSPQTQSHTIDITNYNSEIKIWERILTKFDLRLTKENMENYSLSLVKNGIKGKFIM